ncbi:Heterokaryon incompatibility protein 6, OR allele [Fusarium odoratissimum]|uniref:Heterokaryon incompatibility protein 6, OR allele n=1 Tax=Fusarium oxysporum f. sp. cubense (strain race 4) TaxID=2502994 RepID=N1RGI8_FUSC4|nr:Heterokaryon incompatibility protein 6, OR allele [Fusarium odoratissimum]
MSAKLFSYKPLYPRPNCTYIRLLRLHPSTAVCNPLTGDLEDYPLGNEEVGMFETLSYIWGDAFVSEYMVLGGKRFSIRQNLHDALRRLRLSNAPRILWVDSICIDQLDNTEKSAQIPLMGQIYSTARSVIVWLGEDLSPEMDNRLHQLFLGLHQLELYIHGGTVAAQTIDITCEDIEVFLKRPWFSRRWIIQELHNARNVTIYFGCHQLSWKDFSLALETLSTSLEEDCNSLQGLSAYRLIIWRKISKFDSVLESIENFYDFAGMDDRDRIAAFLTLGWPHTSVGSDFLVNYAQSVEENYIRFTIHMIKVGKCAEILLAASHGYRGTVDAQNHLPSWVPDWRIVKRPNIISRPYGDFNVHITDESSVEFVGRKTHVFSHDQPVATDGVHPDTIQPKSKIQWLKGDFICNLVSGIGIQDTNKLIMRRCRESNRFAILGGAFNLAEVLETSWENYISKLDNPAEQRFIVK